MNQEDNDSINNKLYSHDVPNEPIKKIMFFFAVIKEAIDYPFPGNFINFEHPYFSTYKEMEEFLALSQSLNPEFLYYNNVIIYHNDKSYYKYYQVNEDQNGIPYEFKVISVQESMEPVFMDNYKNAFNISNIDKKQIEFDILVPYKSKSLHSEGNIENDMEDDYLNEDDEEENISLFNLFTNNIDYDDSINEINDYEYCARDNDQLINYNAIKKFCKKNDNIYNSHFKTKNNRYKNQMISEKELDCDETITGDSHIEKVKVTHKLVVTNDWINFIYIEPQKELLSNMKKAIQKDEIRTKSISLPKNAFFYLGIIVLIFMAVSSWLLFSWSTTLRKDHRFAQYKGHNKNNTNSKNKEQKYFHESIFLLENSINYNNDTVIIPEPKKFKKILKGCQFGQASSIFATIFLIFLIYLRIRISREKKAKYQKYVNRKKVGLNICHIFAFILFVLAAFILTLVAEIFIIISLTQKTYNFIKVMVRNQLIGNSLLFVWYLLFIIFYCRI